MKIEIRALDRKIVLNPDFSEAIDATFPRTATRIDLGFQRQVEHIAKLGPRPLAELLLELRQRFGEGWIDQRLARYASLDPNQVHAIGANQWPAHLAAIDGGRR